LTRRITSRATGLGLTLVVALFIAACSSSGATSAPSVAPATTPASAAPASAPAGGATGNAVSIEDFKFTPAALTAKVGQEITWTNKGSASHTVTFDGGPDSGTLAAGETFKNTFAAAGTFNYKCNFHSQMTGTVTVTQ
jgi:plastocyanin